MGRRITIVVLVGVFLAGAVFALQGLRVLPSQVMYGKPEWIVIGVAMMLVSAGVLVRTARR